MRFGIITLFLLICSIYAKESEFLPLFSKAETTEPVVALTFDDGPHALYTAEILDILNEHNVKATFFVVGYNVRLYKDLVRDIYMSGHEIGNHSYSHEPFSKMSNEDILVDLARSQKILKEITGVYPKYFRPPYGRLTQSQEAFVSGYFDELIKWSLDPKDWEEDAKSGTILVSILEDVQPGDIVLLHSDKRETIKMLPALIENLLHRGMQFVTISELRQLDSIEEKRGVTHAN